MSDRIADLEAEVAYYRSELGIAQEATRVHNIRLKCRATNSEARVLLALYAAQGRVLSQDALFDAIPHPADGQNSTAVRMHVRALRQKVSPDVIDTAPGLGYRIGAAGKLIIETC